MSYSYPFASNEFATLCQSQIKLLTDSLGAMSSAIYLAEEVAEDQEEGLVLFLDSPSAENDFPPHIKGFELLRILDQFSSQNSFSRQSIKNKTRSWYCSSSV